MPRTTCPHCRATFPVKDAHVGKSAVCPKCKERFRVTVPAPPIPDRPEAAAVDKRKGHEDAAAGNGTAVAPDPVPEPVAPAVRTPPRPVTVRLPAGLVEAIDRYRRSLPHDPGRPVVVRDLLREVLTARKFPPQEP